MAIQIETDVTLNGHQVWVTAFEDADGDSAAENQERTRVPDGVTSITLGNITGDAANDYWFRFDLETADTAVTPEVHSVSVTDFNPSTSGVAVTDTTLNSETVRGQVREDVDGDGQIEQAATFIPASGTGVETDLFGLDFPNNTYEVLFELETGDTAVTPEVHSITLEGAVEYIQAQDAPLSAEPQDGALTAGGASIQAQEATLSTTAQNAGIDPSGVAITADVGILDATGSDASVSVSVATIDADLGTLQIEAQTAARVFDSTTLSGTVTLDGSGVEGAKIYCIDDTNESIAEVTTTDTNGDYRVRVDTGDLYHMVVQYDDGDGTQYNDESKPFLAT